MSYNVLLNNVIALFMSNYSYLQVICEIILFIT